MALTENIQRNHSTAACAPALARPRPVILVAEDNADSREVMQLLLESKGYDVLSVGDGVHAITAAIESIPDLILIDLELPKLDGLSVARDFRLQPRLDNVPIIIVSGYDPSSYRQTALDAGCDDYILKPINFDRLHELIESLRLRIPAANRSQLDRPMSVGDARERFDRG